MEIVRTRDGKTIKLRPCPRWCTRDHQFGSVLITHASDGFHHRGRPVRVETSTFVDLDKPVTVEIGLISWTCPLDADPGPTKISLDIVSGDSGMDLTLADARRVAEMLIKFCDGIAVETDG